MDGGHFPHRGTPDTDYVVPVTANTPGSGSGIRRPQRAVISLLSAICLLVVAVVALASCGSVAGRSTGTGVGPSLQSYAYLYSRVDYPLQIALHSSDNVTLTLSPKSHILTVTPRPGTGNAAPWQPIQLPVDLSNYQDIGAEAQTVESGNSPIVWQLESAPRQSLLTPEGTGARAYRDSVTFTWRVAAVASGQNTVQIMLRLYYVYLDGSEHDGTAQLSQSPIPIVGAAVSPLDTTLSSFKLPLAGLTWLGALLAVARFVWKAVRTVRDVAEPIKDVADAAGAIRKRIASSQASAQQPDPGSHGYFSWSESNERATRTPPAPNQRGPHGTSRGGSVMPPWPGQGPERNQGPLDPRR